MLPGFSIAVDQPLLVDMSERGGDVAGHGQNLSGEQGFPRPETPRQTAIFVKGHDQVRAFRAVMHLQHARDVRVFESLLRGPGGVDEAVHEVATSDQRGPEQLHGHPFVRAQTERQEDQRASPFVELLENAETAQRRG